MREFNQTDEENICNLYEQKGETLTFISQIYHCRTEAIKAVLTKYQIKIKTKGQSKNRLLKEDYFKIIDCEEKAYWLGMLFSDGSVVLDSTGKRHPQISLQLKISDKELIEKFRQELCAGGKITYDKRKGKETACLRFRNKTMAEDLSKYGIIPQKTYLTKHLPDISKEFLKDFLRGLLDGDGSIYQETKSQKYRVDFCSYHQSICEEFRNLCNTFLTKKNTNIIANYGTAYHIRFNDQKTVKQLVTALYKGNKIALARKYQMAKNIYEDNNEEDIVYSDH